MNNSLIGFLNTLKYSGTTVTPSTNIVYTFIAAGQSNIDGRIPLVEAPSWLNQSNPSLSNVLMWDVSKNQFNTFKLGVNTGAAVNTSTTWAYDMVFYKLYSDYKNRPIYVVKRSQGGTPIYIDPSNDKGTWNIDFDNIPVGIPKLTQELETRYINAKNYIQNFGKTVEVKAILWYQGGTDVQTAGALDQYKVNFTNVINYIRNTIIGVADTPFVFVTQSENSATYSTQLLQIQTELLSELSNMYMVDAKDVNMLVDNIHVDAAGCEWIGTENFNTIKDF